MSLKREIKRLLEKMTGTHIYRRLSRGIDPFYDIKYCLPNFQVNFVFDVGANIGQSARSYLNKFPDSTIYCFEPVDATFRELQKNLQSYGNVLTFKLALGAGRGRGKMVLEGSSDLFYLLDTSQDLETSIKSCLEDVDVETLDGFCERQNIVRISYLKIDAEGSDLDVLKGADRMLTQHLIDIVEVEAGMNKKNKRLVPFERLNAFLEERHYYLFGIYEQVHEWPTKEPHLRRTNPLFISERVVSKNPATNPQPDRVY
jgi:FkbM family methyltransferase